MASRFPRPLARRDVLYGPDTPRERLVELGYAYLEEDLLFDAADFFCEGRDREGLKIVRSRARETGDAFLLRQVQQACPDLVSKSDWDDLAARAKEIGKDNYADRAESGGAPPPPPLEEEQKLEAGEEGAGEDVGKEAAGAASAAALRRAQDGGTELVEGAAGEGRGEEAGGEKPARETGRKAARDARQGGGRGRRRRR